MNESTPKIETHHPRTEARLARLNELLALPDNPANIQWLTDQSAIQNALLQNYRQIHLAIQAIVFALGSGFAVLALSMNSWLFGFGIMGSFLIGLSTYRKFHKIIQRRETDVSWTHRRIMLTEQLLPAPERHLTLLKISQQASYIAEADVDVLLADEVNTHVSHAVLEVIERVIVGGFSHTRRRVDATMATVFVYGWLLVSVLTVLVMALKG